MANGKTGQVTVETGAIALATDAVTENLKAALAEFDKLTPQQRERDVNAASIANIERKLRTVDILKQLAENDICCDVQTQNCEIDIDES